MRKTLLLLSLPVLLFISSCCHNENVKCKDGRLDIHMVGAFQTSTPLVIRYQQDNAFDIAIDTFVGHFVSTVGTDSAFLTMKSLDSAQPNANFVSDSFANGLVLGYDYKIIFPEDTLTWSITSLNTTGTDQVEMQQCGDKSPPVCTKNAHSCTVNGNTVATITYPSTGYQPFAYINLVR